MPRLALTNRLTLLACALAALFAPVRTGVVAEAGPPRDMPRREVPVPFEDLNVLLENGARRKSERTGTSVKLRADHPAHGHMPGDTWRQGAVEHHWTTEGQLHRRDADIAGQWDFCEEMAGGGRNDRDRSSSGVDPVGPRFRKVLGDHDKDLPVALVLLGLPSPTGCREAQSRGACIRNDL